VTKEPLRESPVGLPNGEDQIALKGGKIHPGVKVELGHLEVGGLGKEQARSVGLGNLLWKKRQSVWFAGECGNLGGGLIRGLS